MKKYKRENPFFLSFFFFIYLDEKGRELKRVEESVFTPSWPLPSSQEQQ